MNNEKKTFILKLWELTFEKVIEATSEQDAIDQYLSTRKGICFFEDCVVAGEGMITTKEDPFTRTMRENYE